MNFFPSFLGINLASWLDRDIIFNFKLWVLNFSLLLSVWNRVKILIPPLHLVNKSDPYDETRHTVFEYRIPRDDSFCNYFSLCIWRGETIFLMSFVVYTGLPSVSEGIKQITNIFCLYGKDKTSIQSTNSARGSIRPCTVNPILKPVNSSLSRDQSYRLPCLLWQKEGNITWRKDGRPVIMHVPRSTIFLRA